MKRRQRALVQWTLKVKQLDGSEHYGDQDLVIAIATWESGIWLFRFPGEGIDEYIESMYLVYCRNREENKRRAQQNLSRPPSR